VTPEIPGSSDVGLDRRKMLIGLLFAGAASVTYARQPRERVDYLGSGKLDDLIPRTIGPWKFATTSGLVVPPEDSLAGGLYSQLLTRVYVNEDDTPIMLLIAQSGAQTGLLQVHRPEFCYPAGGYALSPIVERTVQANGRSFPANQLTATAPGRTEQILYWTRVGDDMPPSWAKQRLVTAMDSLKGVIPDAVLVRVSTVDADSAASATRLADFVARMIDAIPANRRQVLVSKA
jgi:EpsI family protein